MKKAEARPKIDELIFSVDFQTKAKLNKITLPRNLNKEKLNGLLKLRKPLIPEDREILQDLANKGYLDKTVVEDKIERSIKQEQLTQEKELKSQKAKELQQNPASKSEV